MLDQSVLTDARGTPADRRATCFGVVVVDLHMPGRKSLSVCHPGDAEAAAGRPIRVLSPLDSSQIGLMVRSTASGLTPDGLQHPAAFAATQYQRERSGDQTRLLATRLLAGQ